MGEKTEIISDVQVDKLISNVMQTNQSIKSLSEEQRSLKKQRLSLVLRYKKKQL